EYKRSGQVKLPPARGRGRAAGADRPRLKTKDDAEAVQAAARDLQGLLERATDPAVTYPEIKQAVAHVAKQFDKGGLLAVAVAFGVTLNSRATGKLAQEKIEEKITRRKGQSSESRGIVQAQAPAAGAAQAALHAHPAAGGQPRPPDAQPATPVP